MKTPGDNALSMPQEASVNLYRSLIVPNDQNSAGIDIAAKLNSCHDYG
jgi:hypothetical protein